jgi:hypothetical protein
LGAGFEATLGTGRFAAAFAGTGLPFDFAALFVAIIVLCAGPRHGNTKDALLPTHRDRIKARSLGDPGLSPD